MSPKDDGWPSTIPNPWSSRLHPVVVRMDSYHAHPERRFLELMDNSGSSPKGRTADEGAMWYAPARDGRVLVRVPFVLFFGTLQ